MISEEPKHRYLTKKRVILLIVFFLLSIILLALNFIFVLNVKWNSFFSKIGDSFQHKESTIFFVLLASYFIVRFFVNYIPRKLLMRKYNIKLTFIEEINFSMTIFFITLISPSVLLVDPYILFFMRTKGLDMKKASAIVITQEIITQLGVLLLSIPSLIYISLFFDVLKNGAQLAIFIAVIIGCTIDIIAFILTLATGFSINLQYAITRCFNWFKKIFRMRYHTTNQIKSNIKDDRIVKREVWKLIKNWDTSFIILISVIVSMFVNYTTVYFSFKFIGYSQLELTHIDYFKTFSIVNCSSTANRFIPIPGGEFTTEGIITRLLYVDKLDCFKWNSPDFINTNKSDVHDFIHNGTLIWRTSIMFIPALLGIPFFIYSMVNEVSHLKISISN